MTLCYLCRMAPLSSMTGFGKSTVQLPAQTLSFEIKTLNSKQSDINLRLPSLLRPYEAEIRKRLSQKLSRGKIDCLATLEITGLESAPQLNQDLALSYLKQLRDLSEKAEVSGDALGAVMRIPEIFLSSESALKDEDWPVVAAALEEATDRLNHFRQDEGARLAEDLRQRIHIIGEKLSAIEPLEKERKERTRERLQKSLDQLKLEIDEDRFEQELIYYLEKLDITEEKVRLRSHLAYFGELMEDGGPIGKKLGFVSQEIGREINTLGSKANFAPMQKLVVEMKDELEKIKEQVLNIL